MTIGGRPPPALTRGIRALLASAVALLAALLAVVTLLTACAPGDLRARPIVSYTPVPDAELYRRIAALPHVTKVDIDYSDDFPNGRQYRGVITSDGQENPNLTLDRAIPILRQGAADAFILLYVSFPGPDGRTETASSSRFLGPAEADLALRYGPQPGNGTPPASPPVPTPPNWSLPAHLVRLGLTSWSPTLTP